MSHPPPPQELFDLTRRPRRSRALSAGVVAVLLAAVLAALPQAAAAQTADEEQQSSAEFAVDAALVAEVRAKAAGHRNPGAAERLGRIADGMEGVAGGYTSAECRDTAARYGVARVWARWCDEIERRENWTPPEATPQQNELQAQQNDEIAVQNQDNNQAGLSFHLSGSRITTLSFPNQNGHILGVKLTSRPTGDVTVLFLTNNFDRSAVPHNMDIDPFAAYVGNTRPNVGRWIQGIHRERCNQSGNELTRDQATVHLHNLNNPEDRLLFPDADNYTLVCETIMTFTPQNWDIIQSITIAPRPRAQRLLTPQCTGLFDGEFPVVQCDRDQLEVAAFSYDGGYPYSLNKLDVRYGF